MFVVSRSASVLEDAHVCSTVEEAAERARQTGRHVFSAGGASIHCLTMPMADAMYLSIIKGDYAGDIRFPEVNEDNWRERRLEDLVFVSALVAIRTAISFFLGREIAEVRQHRSAS